MAAYLPNNEEATKLRVSWNDYGWLIDAASPEGDYTESCWDWDFENDQYIATLERALELAQEFAKQVTPHLVGTRPRVSVGDIRFASEQATKQNK